METPRMPRLVTKEESLNKAQAILDKSTIFHSMVLYFGIKKEDATLIDFVRKYCHSINICYGRPICNDHVFSEILKIVDMFDNEQTSGIDALRDLTEAKETSIEQKPRSRPGAVRLRWKQDKKYALVQPLFTGGRHACWGLDCPFCQDYTYESACTEILGPDERDMKCGICEESFFAVYPFEQSDYLEPIPHV